MVRTRHEGKEIAGRQLFSRLLRCGVTLATLGVGLAQTAQGQTPFMLTFDAFSSSDPSGITYVDNCYMEGGFTVTAVGDACGMAGSLASYTSADPTGYTGSGALFSTFQPSIDLTPTVGGAFSLTSIGLAPFLLGAFDANPISVLFTGMGRGGMTVTQTVNIGTGQTGLTTYTLDGFANLSSLRLTVTSPSFEPYVQIDDVVGTVTATPEPATIALMSLGLAGVGVVARRRRRPTRPTP